MNTLQDNFTIPHLNTTAEGQLSVDVHETENEIIIQSTIAGVRMEDLDIYVNPDMVTIRGERTQTSAIQQANSHLEECFWGAFSRTILLPAHVRPNDAKADLTNGVLTLTLPKEVRQDHHLQIR